MRHPVQRVWKRLITPRSWDVGTRRLFLLAFPISLPLWLAAVILFSIAFVVRSAVEPLAVFWSAPPQRRGSSSYGYGRRGNSSAIHVCKRDAA